jgi:demethylmenaquinone methyltransferase/2-methoxy-6-polyprenyl-1,4-benzoquinol methylase
MNARGSSNRNVLAEQVAYCRARAPEYDEWFERRGAFDMGPEENQRWHEEVAMIEARLGSFDPRGSVLELACGTGLWTDRLAQTATSIVAVDALGSIGSRRRV